MTVFTTSVAGLRGPGLTDADQERLDGVLDVAAGLHETLDKFSTSVSQNLGLPIEPPSGGTGLVDTIFMYAKPLVASAAAISAVTLNAAGAGEVELFRYTLNGANVVQVARYTAAVDGPGLVTLFAGVPVSPGERLAIRAAGVATYDGGYETDGGYYAINPDGTLGTLRQDPRLLIRITYTSRTPAFSGQQFLDVEAQVADLPVLRNRSDALGVAADQRIGRPVDPVAGSGGVSANTYAFGPPAQYGGLLREVRLYALGAGQVTIAAYTRSDTNLWSLKRVTDPIDIGGPGLKILGTDVLGAFPVDVGDYLAFYPSAPMVSYTDLAGADGAWWQVANGQPANIVVDPVVHDQTDAPRPEISFIVSGFDQVVSADSFEALRSMIGGTPRRPLEQGNRVDLLGSAGWQHLMVYGQSLSTGIAAQPALSTVQPYANVTFGSGVRSSSTDSVVTNRNSVPGTSTVKPLVEENAAPNNPAADGGTDSGETICTAMADAACEIAAIETGVNPTDLAFFASAAGHTGSDIGYLSDPDAHHPWGGSGWFRLLVEHLTKAKQHATANGRTYACNVVVYMQGEADAAVGTTRAEYRERLIALREDIDARVRAITGQTSPVHMLVYQTAASNGPATLDRLSAIKLAQVDAITQSPLIHFAGPVYHLPAAVDAIHLTNAAIRQYGRHVGRCVKQLMIDGVEPDCIWPLSATARGAQLRVQFRVPTYPLRIDEEAFGLVKDRGFRVRDAGGEVAISDIRIAKTGDAVVMTLARGLGAGAVVRHALDFRSTKNRFTVSASGCLRDSTADDVGWHVAPSFELDVIRLAER